jgi:hypothetical protein
MKATEDTYSTVVGGYRVRFTNWASDRETFFQTKSDAQDYVTKFARWGYTGVIDEICFNVKEAN